MEEDKLDKVLLDVLDKVWGLEEVTVWEAVELKVDGRDADFVDVAEVEFEADRVIVLERVLTELATDFSVKCEDFVVVAEAVCVLELVDVAVVKFE